MWAAKLLYFSLFSVLYELVACSNIHSSASTSVRVDPNPTSISTRTSSHGMWLFNPPLIHSVYK